MLFAEVIGALHRRDVLKHLRGNTFSHLRPNIDDLVIALTLGQQALGVLLLDLFDFLVGLIKQLILDLRYDHITDRDRQTRLGRVAVAGRAERISNQHGLLRPAAAEGFIDQLGHFLLTERTVDHIERNFVRQNLRQQGPPNRRLNPGSTQPYGDRSLQRNAIVVISCPNFLDRTKDFTSTMGTDVFTSQIIDTKDNILRRHNHRVTRSRRQDVVGGHHQDPSFKLRFHR